MDFYVTAQKIKRLKQLKYLRRVLLVNDDDIYAVEAQLKKAQMRHGKNRKSDQETCKTESEIDVNILQSNSAECIIIRIRKLDNI